MSIQDEQSKILLIYCFRLILKVLVKLLYYLYVYYKGTLCTCKSGTVGILCMATYENKPHIQKNISGKT